MSSEALSEMDRICLFRTNTEGSPPKIERKGGEEKDKSSYSHSLAETNPKADRGPIEL